MSGETGKEKWAEKRKGWAAAGLLLGASAVCAGYFMLPVSQPAEETAYSTYEYHIAIISENTDNSFWQDVYAGAVEAGKEYGAYVEQTGEGLVNGLSIEDAINVAIYENVDGILLRPSDEGQIRELIDKACSRGIPVITMQKDVPDSRRQGFVGINDYFLGQEYGRQLMELAGAEAGRAAVLFPGASFNATSRKWFRQGLSSTVPESQIQLHYQLIWDDRGLNNAEDVIHDMVMDEENRPDIIICPDEVITQSACQLIRDMGLAGQVRIIGGYLSESILDGIEQGYIDSTITIDPVSLGQMSVDALMTYKKYHMVSYYTEVGFRLVDRDTAAAYREVETE